MSILLIRSLNTLRLNNNLVSTIKSTSRALSSTHFVQQKAKARNESAVTASSSSDRTDISTDVRPLGERIKENTKTASYAGVIMLGVGVTGIVAYVVFRELFSSSSPQNVFSDALKLCVEDTRIQDALGVPIKGYGEETRRRRRQHAAHSIYERNGKKFIRMQFYIQGIRNKATVHLEKELESNQYRYLFVQQDHYPRETIILEDNRLTIDGSASTPSLDSLKF